MVAKAHTFTLEGPNARHVVVELDVRAGLPAFAIVGLADAAVREARERIQTAIRNSGFEWPRRRITANLAPGDLRKAGPGLDLALACAILAATDQVPAEPLARIGMFGELGLDGSVRPAHGTLAVADEARRRGLGALAVAAPAGHAAALVDGIEVAPAALAPERGAAAAGRIRRSPPAPLRGGGAERRARGRAGARRRARSERGGPRPADRRRRWAQSAAERPARRREDDAGAAASRDPAPLSGEEAVEVARIHGSNGVCSRGLPRRPPFRAPHHATSAAGLLGGAGNGWVGELALAHRGVLFLDEVSEFSRGTLEALRQPLEEGRIRVARARRLHELPGEVPARVRDEPLHVRPPHRAAARRASCACTRDACRGPLLDRIDMRIAIDPAPSALALQPAALTSVRARASRR